MDWEANNDDVRQSTSSTLVRPLTLRIYQVRHFLAQSHSAWPVAEMLAAMKAYANDIDH
jgi:hypothetical protein